MSKNHRRKRSKNGKSCSNSNDFEKFEVSEPKFEIKTSKVMGRYIVANSDLSPGEIIIKEGPIVIGPCVECKIQCLGCYVDLGKAGTWKECPGCRWPICSSSCSGLQSPLGHTPLECSILQETKSANEIDSNNLERTKKIYQAIVPLRCLMLKSTDPSVFSAILDMESHDNIRKAIPEVWKTNQENVVDRIIKTWGMKEFSSEEIHKICGILEVNAFEIGQDVSIRGLYPTAFLMAHDCVPNTNHIDEKDFSLTVRASTKIAAGESITLSYAYTLQNTWKRRQHLMESKFFECQCKRCSDPTELGTYLSALICPKCSKGCVLSKNPLDQNSDWMCNNKSCNGYVLSSASMLRLIERISQELEDIDCNDIESMEKFLHKYRNVLHPSHYLSLSAKVSLSQLYGKIENYIIHNLSDELLKRKIQICQDVLKILDVIEPGATRIRGVTLYELHAPLMISLSRDFERGTIGKEEVKIRLAVVVKCLHEAACILSNEPENSAEGAMGIAASQALRQIKDWDKIVGKM